MTLRLALVARRNDATLARLPKGLKVNKLTDRQLEKIAAEMEYENGIARRSTDNTTANGEGRHLKLL